MKFITLNNISKPINIDQEAVGTQLQDFVAYLLLSFEPTIAIRPVFRKTNQCGTYNANAQRYNITYRIDRLPLVDVSSPLSNLSKQIRLLALRS
jgi:hypothetical protein